MRIEEASFPNCRGIQCPFEAICRNRDRYTDRRNGCETQDYIVAEAKKLRRPNTTAVAPAESLGVRPEKVLSEQGLSKIQLIKQLRDETGASLKTCVDALNYSGYDIIGAKSYIQYGW